MWGIHKLLTTIRGEGSMSFEVALAEEIWTAKYRFEAEGGKADVNFAGTAARVAKAVATAEPPDQRAIWEAQFREAIQDLSLIPAGRILAGAGTDRSVTLFNCFVMGTIPDSLAGIFEHLKQAALTMQQGGGVGMDFSTIRPSGSFVKGVAAEASGPLTFMDCWDSMCRTVRSAGQRRGAMMGCLRIDHPDIEAFIEAKRDPARFRNFNLSVLVTDPFMSALGSNSDWSLVFGGETVRTVRARTLWEKLMRATYEAAEPGVIFVDRVNQQNNLAYCETISASNPCGEQMLPPYGACLLGSINLARLVHQPFEPEAFLDDDRLGELTRTAVRLLDNVIDISRYPLPQQEDEAKAKRRIGLGITGLADALLFCGAAYGSSDAVELTRRWLGTIKREAYRASSLLAEEKGAFPLYDPLILERPNLASLDDETRELIRAHGLRNGCLTSIAPTGTTSLLAGNVSSGIEPVFAYSYARKIREADGSIREEQVEDYALRVWRQVKGELAPPAELFVSAQTLSPSDHLTMQAAAQAFIDSSISKTVNCPENISFEEFADIYVEGYHLGCKGLTTYRPNAVTGSVLSVSTTKQPRTEETLAPRAEQLHGTTYKLKWPESAHAVYVTINDIEQDGARRPFEMFINSKNMEHYAWTLGLTRMVSAVFRRSPDVAFVAEELKAVFDPRGGAWMQGRYVPSLLAAIGDIVERHLDRLEMRTMGPKSDLPFVHPFTPWPCPQCGASKLVKIEGCNNCLECGYSKCG
jgi:ribonucleoside-diphosphate reductase alpha chain